MRDGVPLDLEVGPTREGLWLVHDAAGACGALFRDREAALKFARELCEAGGAGRFRVVAALDVAVLFDFPAEAAPPFKAAS